MDPNDLTPPSLKEELDRKTVDFLLDLVSRLEDERVTAEKAVAQAHAVWQITSGLVSADVSSLAEKVCSETIYKADHKKIYLRRDSDGNLCRVAYSPDQPYVYVRTWTAHGVGASQLPAADADERKAALLKLFKALRAQGYQPI